MSEAKKCDCTVTIREVELKPVKDLASREMSMTASIKCWCGSIELSPIIANPVAARDLIEIAVSGWRASWVDCVDQKPSPTYKNIRLRS